jgi:hypothetical protein
MMVRPPAIPLLGAMPPRTTDNRAEVFAAYPYRLDAQGYRQTLLSIEAEAHVKFRFVDDDRSAPHIIEKARTLLTRCRAAVFDLSGWNANVSFEFGIAIGFVGMHLNNVYLLLNTTENEEDVPSDLRGLAQLRYASLPDLKSQLSEELRRRFPIPPDGRPFR